MKSLRLCLDTSVIGGCFADYFKVLDQQVKSGYFASILLHKKPRDLIRR